MPLVKEGLNEAERGALTIMTVIREELALQVGDAPLAAQEVKRTGAGPCDVLPEKLRQEQCQICDCQQNRPSSAESDGVSMKFEACPSPPVLLHYCAGQTGRLFVIGKDISTLSLSFSLRPSGRFQVGSQPACRNAVGVSFIAATAASDLGVVFIDGGPD